MLKIKNGRLDQYGAEPFKEQQFGTAGIEGVNTQRSGMDSVASMASVGKRYSNVSSTVCVVYT